MSITPSESSLESVSLHYTIISAEDGCGCSFSGELYAADFRVLVFNRFLFNVAYLLLGFRWLFKLSPNPVRLLPWGFNTDFLLAPLVFRSSLLLGKAHIPQTANPLMALFFAVEANYFSGVLYFFYKRHIHIVSSNLAIWHSNNFSLDHKNLHLFVGFE